MAAPVVTLVDAFTGSNGSINGRTSGPYTWATPGFAGDNSIEIISNVIVSNLAESEAFINNVQFGPDLRVGLRIGTLGTNYVAILVRSPQTFPNATWGSSTTHWDLTCSRVTGTNNDKVVVTRRVASAGTDLTPNTGSDTGFDFAAADLIVWEVVESGGATVITVWRNGTQLCTWSDNNGSRQVNHGYVGVDLSDTGWVVDDFRADTIFVKTNGIFVPCSVGGPKVVTAAGKTLGLGSTLTLGMTRAPSVQKLSGIISAVTLGAVRSVKLLQALVSPTSIGLTNKKTNAWGSWSTVFQFTTTLASIQKQLALTSPASSGYARTVSNIKTEGATSVLAIGIARSTVTSKTHGRISPVSVGLSRATVHVKTAGMSSALSMGITRGQGAQRNLGLVSASSLGLLRVTRQVKSTGTVSGAQTGSQRLLAYVRVLGTIVSAASIGENRIIRHVKTLGIVSATSLSGVPSKMLVLDSPVSMGFVKVLKHVKTAGAVSAASIGVSKVSAGVKTVGIVSPVSSGHAKAKAYVRLSGISSPLSTGTPRALAQARTFGIVSKPHISNPNVVVLVRIVGIVTPAKVGVRVIWTFNVDPNRYAPAYLLEADALESSEVMSVGQGLS